MKIASLHREFRHYALAERGLRPATLRDILVVIRRLCTFSETDELDLLSTATVRAFLGHGRTELAWSARTYRLYRQYLSTFFSWCVRAGYLEADPARAIERPRLPQNLPRCLSREEARRVLYAATRVPWQSELQRCRSEALVATLLMTGLRRSELLNLRRADVDFEAGVLAVHGGKGGKDRTVPLHPNLVPILRRFLTEKDRRNGRSEWLFSSLKSPKQLTAKNLYAVLKRIGREAGVKFTPHMLRHTFGRELVEADFNIYKLKEVMGHSSVSTTQIYVALSPQSIKTSFERTRIY